MTQPVQIVPPYLSPSAIDPGSTNVNAFLNSLFAVLEYNLNSSSTQSDLDQGVSNKVEYDPTMWH